MAAFEPPQQMADTVPADRHVTDYDRAHAAVYMRLLEAASTRTPWRDVARMVLDIDAATEPRRARQRYDSHMARARWMSGRR